MAYINILSSIVYSFIGYMVLFQIEIFLKSTHLYHLVYFYMFFIMTVLIYIATQGLAVVSRKLGNTLAFSLDFIFSFIPLVIVIYSYSQSSDLPAYLSDFRIAYLAGIIIDLIIFIPVCYKFAKYGVHTD